MHTQCNQLHTHHACTLGLDDLSLCTLQNICDRVLWFDSLKSLDIPFKCPYNLKLIFQSVVNIITLILEAGGYSK